LNHQVFLAGSAFTDASELITKFGPEAGSQAKARARRSRDLGNVVLFCHWREIERLIGTISRDDIEGPLQ
jgi:hypothetical protein